MNPLKYISVSLYVALILLTIAPSVNANVRSQIIQTKSGAVQGLMSNNVERYLGIPYANPPIERLRWQPPQEIDPWQGVLQATKFGNACFQDGNFYTSNDPATFEKPYGDEDCLYLNIWKPKMANKSPVLFFIHGGSGIHGAASLPLYDGERMAREMGAIIVSINYRLAFLGNLQLDALQTGDPEGDSGEFALLDKIEALRWVSKNIQNFGGDPNNVTIMGQSAGCAAVWSLMRSPLATGTFNKSICLSGLPLDNTRETQFSTSNSVLINLLIADKKIDDESSLQSYLDQHSKNDIKEYLYSKTAEEILAAGQGISVVPGAVDGYVITAEAYDSVVNKVPSIIGQTSDEAPLLMLGMANQSYTSLWNLMNCDCDFKPADLFDNIFQYSKYKIYSWVTNTLLLRYVTKGANTLSDGGKTPVYRFQFDWNNQPSPWDDFLGAYHGIDIPFIFGNFKTNEPNFTFFSWRKSSELELEKIHHKFEVSMKGFLYTNNPNALLPSEEWLDWGKAGKMISIK